MTFFGKKIFDCNRSLWFGALAFVLTVAAGCGYTTRSTLPKNIKTIYISNFKNSIVYTTESNRNLYFPLLEVNARNAIINRFLFDGNLKIGDPGSSDLLLKGELVSYNRTALRYTDNDDAQEYRVTVVVKLEMLDNHTNEVKWAEGNFTGEATYFVSGPTARSEKAAVDDAIEDLAKRVVERTVEDW